MLPSIVRFVALASLTVPSMAQPGGADADAQTVPDSVAFSDTVANPGLFDRAAFDSLLMHWRQRTDPSRRMRERALQNAAVDPMIVAFPRGRVPAPMPNGYREGVLDPRSLIDPGPPRMKPIVPGLVAPKPPTRAKP